MADAVRTHYPSHEEMASRYSSVHDLDMDKEMNREKGEGKLPDVVELEAVKATPEEMTEAKQNVIDLAKENAEKPKIEQKRVPTGFVGLNEKQVAQLKALEKAIGQVVKGVEYENRFSAGQMIQLAKLYEGTYNKALKLAKQSKGGELIEIEENIEPVPDDQVLAYLDKALKPPEKKGDVDVKDVLLESVKAVKAVGEIAYVKEHLLDADEAGLKDWTSYISRVSDALANAKKGASIDAVVMKVMKGMGEQIELTDREVAVQENIRWLGAVAKMANVKPGEGSHKEVAKKMFDNIMAYKLPSYKKDTLRNQFELTFG
jgi:hypothetical protein